jgi:O-antigen chain-terminating methyltransferase
MFSASDPDISVDQLMHEIRAAVARRRTETSRQPTTPIELSEALTTGNGLSLQSDFEPHANDRYHVNDFLKYHGATFVRNAYLGILKRPPDQQGNDRFLSALATGRLNKIDVLALVRYSDEGRRSGVNIAGLAVPAFVRKLERIPLLGYLVAVVIAIARFPNLHRQLRQSEFHRMTQQEALLNHFDRLHHQSLQNFQEAIGQVTQIVADQQRTLATITERQEQFQERQTAIGDDLETLQQTIDRLSEGQTAVQHRLTVIEDQAKSWSLDDLYAAFEDEFRGEREEIKKRLEVYLPIVRANGITADVVDLGCGRGEWLELMREAGVPATGVDHNPVFLQRCRQQGLNAIDADAIAYLQGLPAASLSLVTGFHIVEHVPFKELVLMIDEIVRVLKPGGVVILETPNPENFMVGSYTFYTDPTHRNPIPSSTLQFLLEMRGFGRTEVMKLREWKDAFIPGDSEVVKRFNEYFYGAPDYAVVGWNVPAAER